MSMPPPMGQPSSPEPSSRSWLTSRTVGAAVIVAISIIFVLENTQRVRVRFLVPKVSAPLWLALVVAFALGAAFGLFLSRRRSHRSQK
ncbi:MAG: LapA family protein [Frankiaceae bacterium]|nr:LapA family protein [Frankiaceae bacterium]